MRIVSFYNEDWEKEYLESRLEGHEIVFLDGVLQDHEDFRDEEAEVLSVFIKSKVGAEEMDRMPNLKLISTRSTGFDHIDLQEAKKRGIAVSNVPTYGENTVAEYAFALLLMVSRRMYESYDRVLKSGNFTPEGLRGFDLKGKKIGVVGTGHIGQHSIRIAKGFGMEVICFDVRENHELATELGFMYVSFEDLLAQADIITLHAPYNEHTHHMINQENIGKVKRGAYLINTARGGLVDTGAMIRGLEEGILAGAGLDVVEEEGYMADDTQLLQEAHPNPESLQTLLRNQYLIDHPRVVIVPHNAFNTIEAIERILDTTVENINAGASGEPVNVVNP
jgi:D-lactate dehydrogenase